MKKKALIMTMTLALVTGLFAGCGSEAVSSSASVSSKTEISKEVKSETSTSAKASTETKSSTETSSEASTSTTTETSTKTSTDTSSNNQEAYNVDRSRVLEILSNINIGWNLGNTLDATGGGNSVNAETSWGNPKTTQEIVDTVNDRGFNAIRIPVTFANHLGPAPEYTISADWLARVKEVVDYAVNDGMYIILDTHHETNYWLKTDPNNEAALCEELAAIWKQVAEAFKDYDEKLMFEGMNEPRMAGSAKEWSGGTPAERKLINAMNKAFIDAVRATGGNNAERVLIICTYGHNSDEPTLKDLEIPSDPNIAVALHTYTPYFFTYVADGSYSVWNGSKKNDITWQYNNIKKYLIDKGIPVVITETGAQFKDNTEDIVRWVGDYVGTLDQDGVKCFIWDNNIYHGSGEKFGLLNRSLLKWYNDDIVDAYVNHAK